MAYVVFARKYRPQSFDDMVGQEAITRTVSQAIAQDRVAWLSNELVNSLQTSLAALMAILVVIQLE